MNRDVGATIVGFHSDPRLLVRAVRGAMTAGIPPGRILVHLNGATEPGVDLLPAGVCVSWSEENLGFAGGHNRLLSQLFANGAEVVIVHNPDLVMNPAALEALTTASVEDPTRLIGPYLERADERLRPTGLVDSLGIRWTATGRHLDIEQGCPLPHARGSMHPVAGLSGACLVVSRAVYERVLTGSGEFFDEDFVAYREDAELALRAQILGVASWVVPEANVLHVRSQRGTDRGGNTFVDLLGVRNRFLLAFKWGRRRPGIFPLVLLRDLTVVAAVVIRERSSRPGLAQAWRLRRTMLAKRRRVLAWARAHPLPGP